MFRTHSQLPMSRLISIASLTCLFLNPNLARAQTSEPQEFVDHVPGIDESQQLSDLIQDLRSLREFKDLPDAALFSREELQQIVDPRIATEKLSNRVNDKDLARMLRRLSENSGIVQCSGAVQTLRNAPRDHSDPQAIKSVEEALLSYDQYCLNLTPLPASLEQARFGTTVGVLVDGEGAVFCGAVRVRSGQILTARHCFFSPADSSQEREFNEAWFSPFAGTNSAIQIASSQLLAGDDFTRQGDSIRYPRDHLLLNLESDTLPQPLIRVRTPKMLDELVVAGYFERHDPSRRLPAEGEAKWRVGARWVGGGTCLVHQVTSEGCAYHSCQSEHGLSGAPLISRNPDKGSLVLLGVHVADATDANGCEPSVNQGLGNIAAPLPPTLFSQSQGN